MAAHHRECRERGVAEGDFGAGQNGIGQRLVQAAKCEHAWHLRNLGHVLREAGQGPEFEVLRSAQAQSQKALFERRNIFRKQQGLAAPMLLCRLRGEVGNQVRRAVFGRQQHAYVRCGGALGRVAGRCRFRNEAGRVDKFADPLDGALRVVLWLEGRLSRLDPFGQCASQARREAVHRRLEQAMGMIRWVDQFLAAATRRGDERYAFDQAFENDARAVVFTRGHDRQAIAALQIGQGLFAVIIVENGRCEWPGCRAPHQAEAGGLAVLDRELAQERYLLAAKVVLQPVQRGAEQPQALAPFQPSEKDDFVHSRQTAWGNGTLGAEGQDVGPHHRVCRQRPAVGLVLAQDVGAGGHHMVGEFDAAPFDFEEPDVGQRGDGHLVQLADPLRSTVSNDHDLRAGKGWAAGTLGKRRKIGIAMRVVEKGNVIGPRSDRLHDPQRLAQPIVPATLVVDAHQVDAKRPEGCDLLLEAAPEAEGPPGLNLGIENVHGEAGVLQRQGKAPVGGADSAVEVRPGNLTGDDADTTRGCTFAGCMAGDQVKCRRSVDGSTLANAINNLPRRGRRASKAIAAQTKAGRQSKLAI